MRRISTSHVLTMIGIVALFITQIAFAGDNPTQPFSAPPSALVLSDCDCRPGDANGDGRINIADVLYVHRYVFVGGPPPTPYAACSGDFNGDCDCNSADCLALMQAIMNRGTIRPPTCLEWQNTCGNPRTGGEQ
jgi:hypothetical protein